MQTVNLAIATISWARTSDEEAMLCESLQALSTLGLPVFLTDGGSSKSFINFVKNLPNFFVFSAKGLWPQAKNSILQAVHSGAKTIFYTEPDKMEFFSRHLPNMIAETNVDELFGVAMASRSAKAFASFPLFQQMTETTINNCCKEIIGVEADYCYGPFFFNPKLLPHLDALPQNCGWGWRPFVFAMAHRLGYSVDALEGDFFCPQDQRNDDTSERIYRMKQLTQNIEGLVLVASTPLL